MAFLIAIIPYDIKLLRNFLKKSSVLTKSSTDTNLWIQADTLSLMEKCNLSIFSLRFSLSFLLTLYPLF